VATELTTAVTTAGFAVGLVDLSDCTIASISEAWLSHLGLPAEAVVGHPAIDLVRFDKEAALQVLTSMRDGAINAYVARRELNAPSGVEPLTTVWVRSFHLADRHLAFVQAAPASDDIVSPITKHLGREPATLAIGTIDPAFTITAMSRDITDLLGEQPEDLVGQVLLTVVARRDVSSLLAATDGRSHQTVALTIHLRDKAGDWVGLCCVLTSLAGNPDRCFILAPEIDAGVSASRLSELEHHLWGIAAIVEASGVLQGVGPMRDMTAFPQANSLTTRQWEILARIARGERVPTIATDLYVSQSTVRNHLSAIFKRFGVRSQPELLRVINDARGPKLG
jgi:DNA-binding CsgD family transcriptional regulator